MEVLSSPAPAAAVTRDVGDLKTSWPEVVGWVVLNACDKITSDRPDVSTPFYSETTPLPPGYDPNRVFIIFDNLRGTVVKTPVIG